MEYQQVMKNPEYRRLYETEYSKELGRIAQGMPGQEGTNTLFFNEKICLPVYILRDITYVRVVVSYRPEKDVPYRVWILRRQQHNTLPILLCHTNSGHVHSQTTPEQHDVDTK